MGVKERIEGKQGNEGWYIIMDEKYFKFADLHIAVFSGFMKFEQEIDLSQQGVDVKCQIGMGQTQGTEKQMGRCYCDRLYVLYMEARSDTMK